MNYVLTINSSGFKTTRKHTTETAAALSFIQAVAACMLDDASYHVTMHHKDDRMWEAKV